VVLVVGGWSPTTASIVQNKDVAGPAIENVIQVFTADCSEINISIDDEDVETSRFYRAVVCYLSDARSKINATAPFAAGTTSFESASLTGDFMSPLNPT
jgi:hypothetical protein